MGTRNVTTQEFDDVVGQGIVLVDWWAGWCGPCRAFAPIFEAASARHPDVTFAKVDTDAEPALSGTFGIRSIPTLMALRDGIVVFAQAGLLPASALDALIDKLRALDMDDVRRKLAEAEARAGAAS